MEVAGRMCRQLILRFRLAIAAEDAFDIDQTDRDLSRDLEEPSAGADGHELDSKKELRETAQLSFLIAQGAGRHQLRRALKPDSRPEMPSGLTASKIFARSFTAGISLL